jgi:hypothetical protein
MRETLLTGGSILLAAVVGGALAAVAFGLFGGTVWRVAMWVVG